MPASRTAQVYKKKGFLNQEAFFLPNSGSIFNNDVTTYVTAQKTTTMMKNTG